MSCLFRRHIIILDSEWHVVSECPLVSSARRRFMMHCNVDNLTGSVQSLATLVLKAREGGRLLDGLARFAAELVRARRLEHARLSSRAFPDV